MSCITVRHFCLDSGGIRASSELLGNIWVRFEQQAGILAHGDSIDSIKAHAVHAKGGIRVRTYEECVVNIRKPYLEISPEVVWVLNGWTSNDVYSNTSWNVN